MGFKVKTNFGKTYLWTDQQVAEDYASTAIQFEDNTKTREELVSEILSHREHLRQWFGDYISNDASYAYDCAEEIHTDEAELNDFLSAVIRAHGSVVDTEEVEE